MTGYEMTDESPDVWFVGLVLCGIGLAIVVVGAIAVANVGIR